MEIYHDWQSAPDLPSTVGQYAPNHLLYSREHAAIAVALLIASRDPRVTAEQAETGLRMASLHVSLIVQRAEENHYLQAGFSGDEFVGATDRAVGLGVRNGGPVAAAVMELMEYRDAGFWTGQPLSPARLRHRQEFFEKCQPDFVPNPDRVANCDLARNIKRARKAIDRAILMAVQDADLAREAVVRDDMRAWR